MALVTFVCQGLGRNLTSETEGCPDGGGEKFPKLHSHCCDFTPAFCLAASYLSLLIVWPLGIHALFLPPVHRQNGNKREEMEAQLPACMRKASKKGSGYWEEGRDRNCP